jgi:hypothetical protein
MASPPPGTLMASALAYYGAVQRLAVHEDMAPRMQMRDCAKALLYWLDVPQPQIHRKSDLRIALISGRSPSGIKMMRPSSMPQVSTTPVVTRRRLSSASYFHGGSCIGIQRRSDFSSLERTDQKNKHANDQDACYYLNVHRQLPPLKLFIELRMLSSCIPLYRPGHIPSYRPTRKRQKSVAATTSTRSRRGVGRN